MPDNEKDPVLSEGDCFGWYSSVHAACTADSCVQCERCKNYTALLQRSNDPNFNERLSENEIVLKKAFEDEHKKNGDKFVPDKKQQEVVTNTFFSIAIDGVRQKVLHDNVMMRSDGKQATLKRGSSVMAVVLKMKSSVRVLLGPPSNPFGTLELDTLNNQDKFRDFLSDFLDKNVSKFAKG